MNRTKTKVLKQAAKPQIPTAVVAAVLVVVYIIFAANGGAGFF